MYDYIAISKLNDFLFCPKSLYFHEVYDSFDSSLFHDRPQINGKAKHSRIDSQTYSTTKDLLVGREVYSEKYGLLGKLDIFYIQKGLLVERKARVKQIFDGYVFQLFAQKLCLEEVGYTVKRLEVRSLEDNRVYLIEETAAMWDRFFALIDEVREYKVERYLSLYEPKNKCDNCIYRPLCH